MIDRLDASLVPRRYREESNSYERLGTRLGWMPAINTKRHIPIMKSRLAIFQMFIQNHAKLIAPRLLPRIPRL